MLKLTPMEFIFRGIPESFLIVLVACIFCNKSISKKSIAGATIILAISTYLVRLLPIMFGVHTVLISIIFILIGIYILNISINRAILSILVSIISIIVCELINTYVVMYILKINKFKNDILKIIYDTPSLIMFMIIVFVLFKFNDKFKDKHNKLYISRNND